MNPLIIAAGLLGAAFAMAKRNTSTKIPAWLPTPIGKETDPPFANGDGVMFALINSTSGENKVLYGRVTDLQPPPSGKPYTILVAPDKNDPPAYGYEPGKMIQLTRSYLGLAVAK